MSQKLRRLLVNAAILTNDRMGQSNAAVLLFDIQYQNQYPRKVTLQDIAILCQLFSTKSIHEDSMTDIIDIMLLIMILPLAVSLANIFNEGLL